MGYAELTKGINNKFNFKKGGVEVWYIIILGLVIMLYIGWINSSIREIKQKLSNIEELLKNKES